MQFKTWLLTERMKPITQQQTMSILRNHQGVIRSDAVRTDLISQHRGDYFFFDQDFPLSNIPRLTQGYDPQTALGIINTILKSLNLNVINDFKQINHQEIQSFLPQIKKMLPPIIVSLLPDESYHIGDGNHRFGVAKLLGLPTIRAIILQ